MVTGEGARWLFLGAAIGFKVLWAGTLKVSQGFTVAWASAVTVVAYVLSLVCLNVASKGLDISLTSAVRSGVGAGVTLVVVIGLLAVYQRLSTERLWGLVLTTTGLLVLLGGTLQRH